MTLSRLVLIALLALYGCTPAERAKLAVPVLSQIDAIGATIAQAVGWCEDHGADEKSVLKALQAISDKDPVSAVEVVRGMLEASAKAGEPVPPEIVALVQTAEMAAAAEAVQDAMRALSTTSSTAPK